MARLPTPGGDDGNWGNVLNDYLSQTLKPDGTLKDNAVTSNTIAPNAITSVKIASDAVGAAQIADGSISETLLDGSVQTKLNQGAPTWSTLSGKPVVIGAGADQTAARSAINAASRQSYFVDDYAGSDPTGTSPSDAAVAAAIAALGVNPGVIEFGQGRYRLNSTKELAHPGQYFKAQGIGLTTIDYRGTGPALKCWDSTVNPNGLEAPGYGGGVLGGMTIDGTQNTNDGSIGLLVGDLVKPTVEDAYIVGFTRPGSIGFLGQNRYSWTEYGSFRIKSSYNTNCFVLEAHPSHPLPIITSSKTSFSYNYFHFAFSAEANQNGLVVRRHTSIIGASWFMNFNCNLGTTNTAAAITVGENSTDDCHIQGFLAWMGEATNPGDVAHYDMNIGANSSLRGHGSLVFLDYTNNPWRAGTAVPYRVVFSGRVNSPSLGHYSEAEIPFTTIGDPGRFGAKGDDANYINIEEGDNGNWPALTARGPSDDIGMLINTKGFGELQYNYQPVAVTAGAAPATANSPGVWRQMVCDNDYLYVCVSENVWKRIPLQSF